MGGDGHIFWMVFQRFGGNGLEPAKYLFLCVAVCGNFFEEVVIDEVGPGCVINLQITAAVVIEVANGILVGQPDVIDEGVEVVAVVWRFFVAKLQDMVDEDHIWTRYAFLRSDAVIFLSQAMQVVPGIHFSMGFVFVIREFSCNLSIFYFMDAAGQLFGNVDGVESIKFFQPVQVPPSAAKFTIGDELQPMGHFFFNEFCDGLVFNGR